MLTIARVLLGLVVLSPLMAATVNAGCIRGYVRDLDTAQPLAYANVIVVGTTSGTMTLQDGSFEIRGIAPGTYTVRAMMMGRSSATIGNVVVHARGDCGEALEFRLTPPWSEKEAAARHIVGTEVEVSPQDIAIEIRPPRTPFRVGDAPVFLVVMRNVGDKTFNLVGAVDGSEYRARYPHVTLTVEGPSGGMYRDPVLPWGYINDLPVNPIPAIGEHSLQPEDFVTMGPGDELRPITLPFWPPNDVVHARFEKPGQYKVVFRYSSNSIDYLDWEGRSASPPMRPDIVELLRRVPRFELADSVMVTVEE